MSHQMLRSQLNYVDIGIAIVLFVSKESRKHAISVLRSKVEHESPVKEPRRLMKQAHGTLSKALLEHVFDFANCSELCDLTRLVKLDFASQQSPEDL